MEWYNSVILFLLFPLMQQFMKQYPRMKPVKNDLIFRLEKKMIYLFHIQLRVIQHRRLITHQFQRVIIMVFIHYSILFRIAGQVQVSLFIIL